MNTTNMEQVTIRQMAKEKVKIFSKHNFDYDAITMYIDNCYMTSDAFIKKYFSNERAELKSFIKKTYNRKVTIEDIKELFEELFD